MKLTADVTGRLKREMDALEQASIKKN